MHTEGSEQMAILPVNLYLQSPELFRVFRENLLTFMKSCSITPSGRARVHI